MSDLDKIVHHPKTMEASLFTKSGPGSGGPWQRVSSATTDIGDTIEFSPYAIPNHRTVIRNKQSATTRCTVNGYGADPGDFSCVFTDHRDNPEPDPDETYTYGIQGQLAALAGFPSLGNLAITSENTARANFISKARAAQSQFSIGVAGGELRETIRFVRRPLGAIRDCLWKHVARVKKRGSSYKRASQRELNSVVAGSWLEAQYAIGPLLSDAKSAAEALAAVNSYRRPSVGVRSHGDADVPGGHNSGMYQFGPIKLFWSYRDVVVCKVRYSGSISIADRGSAAVAQAFGFTWQDVIPTMWELIPYSFVADYFANVDDILNALTFNHAAVQWAERGEMRNSVRTISIDKVDYSTQTGWTPRGRAISSGAFARLVRVYKNRDVYNASFIPSLDFKIPGVKQGFNVAALFHEAKAVQKILYAKLF